MLSTKTVAEGLAMLAGELKNAPAIDGDKIRRWVLLFEDWTNAEFMEACVKAARKLTFFPTPGELRAVLRDDGEATVNEAWEMAREMIRRLGSEASYRSSDIGGDGKALWCVGRIGPQRIGATTDETRAIVAAEFRRLYAVATERGYSADYLEGTFERLNTAGGIDTSTNPALLGRPGGFEPRPLTAEAPPPLESSARKERGRVLTIEEVAEKLTARKGV